MEKKKKKIQTDLGLAGPGPPFLFSFSFFFFPNNEMGMYKLTFQSPRGKGFFPGKFTVTFFSHMVHTFFLFLFLEKNIKKKKIQPHPTTATYIGKEKIGVVGGGERKNLKVVKPF